MADPLDSMLDLMRRLPPTQIEENVSALVDICPDYADDFLGSVDQPLKVKTDAATGKEYLTCDYNRDGDSYRYVRANVPRTSLSVEIDMLRGHIQITVVKRVRSTFG